MTRRALVCAAVLAFGAGCEDVMPDLSWERMIDQERGKPYEASSYFEDGRLMQTPPPGTVATDAPRGDSERTYGRTAGREGDYVADVPIAVDRSLLTLGRRRFDTTCAACHGLTGDGDSIVARNMLLRAPPSLVRGAAAQLSAGRIFEVIGTGYGLMPSYAYELSIEERWAVVAYLRVLERSQAVALTALPPDVQRTARMVLP